LPRNLSLVVVPHVTMNADTRIKIPFSSLQDIYKLSNKRAIILFGAGNIAKKTKRILTLRPISGIVDNAPNLSGSQQLGLTIQKPESLAGEEADKPFIIICTTSFSEVTEQLAGMGFEPGVDVVVSPVLNDLRVIDELESIERQLIFSSGAPKKVGEKFGGGIYEMTLRGEHWDYEKKIDGNCYSIEKLGDNFVSVDTEMGIFEFDKDFNIIRSTKLPQGSRTHGVSYSPVTNCFYVVGSYLDAVLVLDSDFGLLDTINISRKCQQLEAAAHHCNDCCVVGNSLFVSMFSHSGNWKLDVFDGVVLEIDIESKEIVGPVIKDLWMPHNIMLIDGSLTVLDSLRGQLKTNNSQVVGEFPAFTRGLAHDGIYYFIGQSRNRNHSKNLGLSKNISIDSGIVVFDAHTKASRFLQLPSKISEIHSIVLA
jgi:hypothetical protein